MKQLLILLLLLSSFTAKTFAAGKEGVPTATLEAFQKTFESAKEASWSWSKDFYKVDFQLNCQYLSAYYNEEGNLLATTRNILSTQLPLMAEASLRANFCDYWISDLMEVSNEAGVSYYATLENADTKLIVRSFDNSWTVWKKIKK
jgi:hypothetical protein